MKKVSVAAATQHWKERELSLKQICIYINKKNFQSDHSDAKARMYVYHRTKKFTTFNVLITLYMNTLFNTRSFS